MTYKLPPSNIRLAVLFGIISLHMTWVRYVNQVVPDPYLDEVFHIPQAQAYWAGRWSHWDSKITTPPGLYLWSYAFNSVRRVTARDPGAMLTTEELRFSNAVVEYVLMVTLYFWGAVAGKNVHGGKDNVVLQKEVVVLAFPLLMFFSGLYYTDIVSVWSVVLSFVAWEAGREASGLTKFTCQIAHLAFGLFSLTCRQTNIFWVAVFLGGMQVLDSVRDGSSSTQLQDPEIENATFEDIPNLVYQLVPATLYRLPRMILDLWPQLALLVSFAAFVVWNGGVVLGDKSNHVATIHSPQLLYIWPCFLFFSWPVVLPQLTSLTRIHGMFPRLWLSAIMMLGMVAAVHYNTIVHPFTLADNRHYVFYVFRILMGKWWIKYAAVPVYFICACLVLGALRNPVHSNSVVYDSVRLSFILVWFASTALSLVTAPLVEPRYFIVPWLVWRMYVPEAQALDIEGNDVSVKTDQQSAHSSSSGLSAKTNLSFLEIVAEQTLWIEVGWYLVVNLTTCWIFLNKDFEWSQEPGKAQRFMW